MPSTRRNRWYNILGPELAESLIEQAYREIAGMPTIEVTIYPKCEAIVERRLPGFKHCRPKEEVCGQEGQRYLIVGDLGTVEQNLCPAHKKAARKQHPGWLMTEIKRAIRKEVREVAANAPAVTVRRVYGPVDDDIPF